MNIAFTFQDYPDPNIGAVEFYFNGCEHNCDDCHSPQFQDKKTEYEPTDIVENIIQNCRKYRTNHVVLCGGDPLHPDNIEITNKVSYDLKRFGYKVCIYTGYDEEYIIKSGIHAFDFIKGGKFDKSQYQTPIKTDEFIRFASKNQFLMNTNYHILSVFGTYTFN